MTVRVTTLLGSVTEGRFQDRRRVGVPVAWDEASRRRLRRVAADGTDVAIELEQPAYLADGTVLADDGERVLIVERKPEPALVVRFDMKLAPATLVANALALGHAFGNQHVPIDISETDVRVPLTTSARVARQTVSSLNLNGVAVSVEDVAMGSQRPLPVGHQHAAAQVHEHHA